MIMQPWRGFPMGTWLEWLQQFVIANTSALALHRLPTPPSVADSFRCRACLVTLLGRPAHET